MVCLEICGCRQQICCRLCLDLCGRASVLVSACNVENHKFVCAFSYMGERNELTETHICHSLFKYTLTYTSMHRHTRQSQCVYNMNCVVQHREFSIENSDIYQFPNAGLCACVAQMIG